MKTAGAETRRYLFGFYKKGNMRFISHLDLQRLFKRCMKRAGVAPTYSKGFNPREKINIVLPLSLGFETDMDYFEMDSDGPYEPHDLLEGMNAALPEGIRFTFCREIPASARNSSSLAEASLYEAFLPSSRNLDTEGFIIQKEILILKRDKKTKSTVEKDVKGWVYDLRLEEEGEDGSRLCMLLRSASNETLNPANLAEALCRFSGSDFDREGLRMTRKDIFVRAQSGFVPLSRAFEDALYL